MYINNVLIVILCNFLVNLINVQKWLIWNREKLNFYMYILCLQKFMMLRYFKVFDIKVEYDLLWSYILVGVLFN